VTVLVYRRSDDVVFDGVAHGRRGTLSHGIKTWPTIERMDGYKWVRPGPYEGMFAEWTGRSGQRSKAIRFSGVYDDRIYIHPANWPKQLLGCIAPGTEKLETGVAHSRDALEEIFTSLGGYTTGQTFEIQVGGSMYAETADLNRLPQESYLDGDEDPTDDEMLA